MRWRKFSVVWLLFVLADEVLHWLQEVQLRVWKQCWDPFEGFSVSYLKKFQTLFTILIHFLSDACPTSCQRSQFMWYRQQFHRTRMSLSFAGAIFSPIPRSFPAHLPILTNSLHLARSSWRRWLRNTSSIGRENTEKTQRKHRVNTE